MNNIFNLKRFLLLFKKHTIEHGKTYLLSIAVLTGMILLLLGFMSFTGQRHLPARTQNVFFAFGMWIIGSIFTSVSFIDLADKKKAVSMLTLPASHLEKFLVQWVYSFLIFQVLFTGTYYLADWIIIQISNQGKEIQNELFDIRDPNELAYYSFMAYAVFNAFALWGAIFFQKLHFIKTTFVFFVLFIVFVAISDPLLHLIVGLSNSTAVPFGAMHPKTITNGNQWWSVAPTGSMKNTNIVMLIITVIILWMSAFYRLKEKEV